MSTTRASKRQSRFILSRIPITRNLHFAFAHIHHIHDKFGTRTILPLKYYIYPAQSDHVNFGAGCTPSQDATFHSSFGGIQAF